MDSQLEPLGQRDAWVPLFARVIVLFVLLAGSVTGLVVSCLVFSGGYIVFPVPSQYFAQSFVMHASILSVIYMVVFSASCLKKERLYGTGYKIPPGFKHRVYAWFWGLMGLATIMWMAAALAVVAVFLYLDDGVNSVLSIILKLDMFSCAAGCFALLVIIAITSINSRLVLGPRPPRRPSPGVRSSSRNSSSNRGSGGDSDSGDNSDHTTHSDDRPTLKVSSRAAPPEERQKRQMLESYCS